MDISDNPFPLTDLLILTIRMFQRDDMDYLANCIRRVTHRDGDIVIAMRISMKISQWLCTSSHYRFIMSHDVISAILGETYVELRLEEL